MKTRPLTLDHYTIIKELGKGVSSKVYLASIQKESKEFYALKVAIHHDDDDNEVVRKSILQEAKILMKLKHPHIVKFHELAADGFMTKTNEETKENVLYSVLQLGTNDTLLNLLMTRGALPEPIARAYFGQLVEGLIYLHGQGFVHRDLKPDNLLIGGDGGLLIADLGHSAELPASGMVFNYGCSGTVEYNPPEASTDVAYKGTAVDAFMAGVVLFIMLTGVRPFARASRCDPLYAKVINNNFGSYWAIQADDYQVEISSPAKKLIWSLLNIDPEKRPSLAEVMNHEWMTGAVASSAEIQKIFKKQP